MNFGTISPREIDRCLFRPDCIVIDIRDPGEFRRLHLQGAVCIPYGQLKERARLLRHKRLVLYCDRGSISMKAARELAEEGYRTATLVGGIQAYKGRNLERYGGSGRVDPS